MTSHTWQSGFNKRKLGSGGAQPHQTPKCPECRSHKNWKDGLRRLRNGAAVQRWICRTCGYRFSVPEESSINVKSIPADNVDRQVCEIKAEDSKNLVTVETTRQEWAAGATTVDVKGKVIQFLWHLKKEGYSKDTIKTYVKILELLIKRGADIFNPESVKEVIAEQTEQKAWGEGRKSNAIKAYSAFMRMQGLDWNKPRYKFKKGLPRPPTPDQVKQLVAGASRKYAPIFRFMAETGASPIEVSCLATRGFDFERRTVYIEGKKGHLDRIVPMSVELSGLMKEFLNRYGSFPSSDMMGRKWRKYRDLLAKKLNDNSLKNIRLYDLRHYFGTMLYAQTGDPLYVRDKMGHTKLETTMIYTKLIAYPMEEEFICKVAENLEQAQELIEAGFEYITDMASLKLFRKRKSLVEGLWSSVKGPGSSEKGPWSSLV